MDDLRFLDDCKCLNDICRYLFGLANYTNREKVKKILFNNGIDWKEWLESKKEIRVCLNCGKKLKRGQYKFCSSSCSAIYNNHLRKEERFCKNCGKPLNGAQKNFCSSKCQTDFQYKEYIKRWKKGEEDGLSGEYGISKHIKRYLFEKYGCKCQVPGCGWGEKNPYTNTIPLEIHHKDGNYRNNSEDNLQLLCPNHHSLTETVKSHNKNGRKGRKKYAPVD